VVGDSVILRGGILRRCRSWLGHIGDKFRIEAKNRVMIMKNRNCSLEGSCRGKKGTVLKLCCVVEN
jgi:hypothetical protein